MLLHTYLAQQCAANGIRRGQIPALLQLANVNKTLRRYDALLAGGLHDQDLLDRIRRCEPLAGACLDEVVDATRAHIERARREQLLAQELKRRREFTPHLWVIHENKIPSPIFPVAMFGIDTFKRVEIPQQLVDTEHVGQRLIDMASWLIENLRDPRYLTSLFGRPTQVLYRDTYDHSYVFDVATRCWVDELHEPPARVTATLTLKNSRVIIPSIKD
ncbi:MAG: hypothetical protein ACK5BQ_00220 [Ignavibacteria bacterium]